MSTKAERNALLRAVIDQPDEDAPRLVLADWYEEHGEPDRAEFIRLQLRRAHLDRLDPEAWRLDRRAIQLESKHHERWRAELPRLKGVSLGTYERGLLAWAGVKGPADLARHGDALFAAAPINSLNV